MNGQTFDPKEYKDDTRRIWDGINNKVSWIVFWAFISVVIGIMVYFSNADSRLNEKIDKNEDRFYQYQQSTNELLSEIKSSVSEIKAKVDVKAIK